MNLKFKIGDRAQDVEVKDENLIAVLTPNDDALPKVINKDTEFEEVKHALENPIGTKRLKDIVKPGEKIAIITSDLTRPMPTWKVMPQLLDELYAGGVKREDITLVFALGSHRKQTEDEQKHLAGERAWAEIKCVDSDPNNCVHVGETSGGTPVDIDRTVIEADKRICIGNIEYHYFAGYSGGAKAIMPGVSTREAIQANHSRMIQPEAHAGKLDGNPIREDIEEACAKVGVDFILNVVLTPQKEIIKAVAGDIKQAHRAGCAFLDTLYRKHIPERADIVLVSQGGSPKDLNLYQTQKALDNSKHAVKNGGVIILIGSCKEGLGEKTFEEWLINAKTSHSLIERIHKEFKLGGHKAAAIAMVLENAEIYLVSDMEDEFVKSLFMTPFKSVQDAYDAAVKKLGDKAKVIAMPYGGSTLPFCE
ncbi:MAG: nickel-dependent lactate racemase [Synergistaceae bacterium]|nr:nickel-dependent lactate racemase [Synergistaceae bacterium]MBQ4418738.1 nickel-dependent lactate racemase [Synergistaceae bacterium]MBQ6740283.1 nickel-dependent lactate racemase [Synergistaceae bacterium]MBQ7569403.1 nickel-dependent lactate racemase [Synergistaceae bacterium]MBQ9896521.1 nickel-dependent lactate racemase [Synergistaceae bacterium]